VTGRGNCIIVTKQDKGSRALNGLAIRDLYSSRVEGDGALAQILIYPQAKAVCSLTHI